MAQANADADRESKVYSTLLNSPDPEIASMAAAGLLESAGPRKRKSGFSGWLGDMQKSPTYDRLRQLIATPTETSPGELPSPAHTDFSGGVIATPPSALGEAPAGTPNQSLTQPGARAAITPTPTPSSTAAALARRNAALPASIATAPPSGTPPVDRQSWGRRADGSLKGEGFLGPIQRPDGKVSSEISVGVNIDGKEVEIPTLVPTLTQEERDWLINNDISDPKAIPASIIQKAVDFARPRIAAGKSPFAQPGEQQTSASSAQPAITPTPKQIPASVGKPPTFGPRRVFATPEETYAAQARGKAMGDVEGDVAGLATALGGPEHLPEARAIVKQQMLRKAAGSAGTMQGQQGTLPDGSLAFGILDKRTGSPTEGRYLSPDTGEPLTGFTPRATTGSVSLGQYYEQAARALGYASGGQAPLSARPAIEAKARQLAESLSGASTTGRLNAAATAPLSTQQRFAATTKLQEDWRKVEAPHREMARQYQLMQTGLNRFNQGDKIGGSQAVLVTFQKILDPTSVVRESEYARSPEGLGLAARIEGYMQRLREGGAGVPPQELAGMVETARQFLEGMTTWNQLEKQRIEGAAKESGLDPNLITGSGAVSVPAVVGTIPPGTQASGRTGTPPPSATRSGGPAGVFVDANGNYVSAPTGR